MTITKKQVLLWSPYGSGEHYNGPAKYTYRIYSEMQSGKFDFSLAHGFSDQPELSLFKEQSLVSDLRPGRLPIIRFSVAGKKWIREHASKFDLFHGVSGYMTTVAAAHEAKKAGLPVVLFVSNYRGGLASKGGIKEALGVFRRRQKIAQQFDAIIALSKEIQTELLGLGIHEDKIISIPNFADTSKYFAVDGEEKLAIKTSLKVKELPTVVFVGRITERKRPHLIGEAIGMLGQRGLDAQAVFVGPFDENDSYYQRIVRTADEKGYGDRLVFTNYTNDVPKWLQASDVFCLPSSNEGMPGALVEALACGLPAVVSPFSSARELICDDVYGMIMSKESSPSELASGLKEFLSKPDSPANKKMRCRFIDENYSVAAIAREYSNLFSRLLG